MVDRARCKGCGAPIVWIVTEGGKRMPCEPGPVDLTRGPGPHVVVTEDGRTVRGSLAQRSLLGDVVRGYVPHWGKCEQEGLFR